MGSGAVVAAALLVRVYSQGGVPAEHLSGALAEVQAIFARVGVRVAWVTCAAAAETADAGSAGCSRPPAAGDVLLRLSPPPPAPGWPMAAMGYAVVGDPRERGPGLATVFPGVVWSVAGRAGVDGATLLGRAIAHEIGHLLLASSRHAAVGLMRPEWSIAELRNPGTDWEFQHGEAAAIRAAAAARAGDS